MSFLFLKDIPLLPATSVVQRPHDFGGSGEPQVSTGFRSKVLKSFCPKRVEIPKHVSASSALDLRKRLSVLFALAQFRR